MITLIFLIAIAVGIGMYAGFKTESFGTGVMCSIIFSFCAFLITILISMGIQPCIETEDKYLNENPLVSIVSDEEKSKQFYAIFQKEDDESLYGFLDEEDGTYVIHKMNVSGVSIKYTNDNPTAIYYAKIPKNKNVKLWIFWDEVKTVVLNVPEGSVKLN